MNKSDIEIKTHQLVDDKVKNFDCEVVDIEYVKEGQEKYLKIFIDKEGGVNIKDCEDVSRSIDSVIEEADYIKDKYILEVSSPGLDRPLKKDSDFEKFKGKIVDVKLYKKVDGIKEYQGELIGLIDNKVVIKYDEDELSFNRVDVAIVRLAVIF